MQLLGSCSRTNQKNYEWGTYRGLVCNQHLWILFLALSFFLDTPCVLEKSSDVNFRSFYLTPEHHTQLSFQCVSCCGYDQNMMQGTAVSEKRVAGSSALPGDEDLTLIVADESWLHSRHSRHKLRSSPENMRATWWDLLELMRQCPMKMNIICNLKQQLSQCTE